MQCTTTRRNGRHLKEVHWNVPGLVHQRSCNDKAAGPVLDAAAARKGKGSGGKPKETCHDIFNKKFHDTQREVSRHGSKKYARENTRETFKSKF